MESTYAISLTQPWATLVAHGQKKCIRRRQSLSFRGKILIHSSEWIPDAAERLCAIPEIRSGLRKCGVSDQTQYFQLPAGRLLGYVTIAGCMPYEEAPKEIIAENRYRDPSPLPYLWVFKNAKPFKKPPRCSGKINIFRISNNKVKRLLKNYEKDEARARAVSGTGKRKRTYRPSAH